MSQPRISNFSIPSIRSSSYFRFVSILPDVYPEKSVEIRAKLRSRVSKPRKYRGRNRKLANLFRPPRVSKKFIASTEDRASLADPPNVPRLSIHYRNTTATLRTNEQNSLTDHLSAYSPRDSLVGPDRLSDIRLSEIFFLVAPESHPIETLFNFSSTRRDKKRYFFDAR